jgi:hypothetical protein
MRVRLSAFVAVLATAAALAVPAATSAATTAPTAGAAAVPITGTLANGGSFAGTFNLQRFANQNGQLVAVGTLSGTLTDALGNVIGTVTNLTTTLQVTANGTCQILHLVLGPLDLNLLGLQVHLNQVVLDITAQSGPGNLLGNLLCSVAHLLDNNGNVLNALVAQLNLILARL